MPGARSLGGAVEVNRDCGGHKEFRLGPSVGPGGQRLCWVLEVAAQGFSPSKTNSRSEQSVPESGTLASNAGQTFMCRGQGAASAGPGERRVPAVQGRDRPLILRQRSPTCVMPARQLPALEIRMEPERALNSDSPAVWLTGVNRARRKGRSRLASGPGLGNPSPKGGSLFPGYRTATANCAPKNYFLKCKWVIYCLCAA